VQLDLETTNPDKNAARPAKYQHSLEHFRDLAIAHGTIKENDDMGVLREACYKQGLKKAAWRFLNRHGKEAYSAMLPMLEDSESTFEIILFYVVWQVRGGLREPLAGELGERIFVCMGGILGLDLKIDARIARVANAYWKKLTGPIERKIFAREEWTRVINWMLEEQPVFDRNQWRAGWCTIHRNYQTWKRLNPDKNTWTSILPAFEQDGLRVQPLTSSYDLAQEGYKMRHCVALYAYRCLADEYRLFSISETSSGQALVTIGILKQDNYWKIDQIKGRFNQVPEARAARLGLVIQRKYLYQEELIFREKARHKMLERRSRIEQVRADHESYLCQKLKIGKVLRDQFCPTEIDYIENHAIWLNALVSGELKPNNYEQVRFIAVTNGIVRPKTVSEATWMKYQRIVRTLH